jgi:hypothetical protein
MTSRSRTPTRSATAGTAWILALAFSLTSAPAAFAESSSRQDQRHDVVTFDDDGGVIHVRHTPDPDVRETKLAHLTDRVTIRLTFADLRRDKHNRRTYGRIITPDQTFGFRSVVNAAHGTATVALRRNGKVVACPHLKQTVRYVADTLTLRVPRPCLGGPRWVQVGVITGLGRPHTYGWWDDGLRDGTNLAFTPKISGRLARAH